MPLAEKGVRGKGRQPLSPPQHAEAPKRDERFGQSSAVWARLWRFVKGESRPISVERCNSSAQRHLGTNARKSIRGGYSDGEERRAESLRRSLRE